MNDPFPPDIPHDKFREHAVKLFAQTLATSPDCDLETVVACMTHWLRCQATLGQIARHIEALDATARQLAKDAAKLAGENKGLTAALIAAATGRN
jgi:hypothetical protein